MLGDTPFLRQLDFVGEDSFSLDEIHPKAAWRV